MTRTRAAILLLALLGAGCLPSGAGTLPANDLSFQGYARDLRSGALLYIESHAVRGFGTPGETRVVLYRCPKGAPFARKELYYGAARVAPEFNFTDARFGYLEGLRRSGLGLEVFQKAGADSPARARPVPAELGIVADAGFDEFVRQHWAELEAGQSVRFPFLVPSRLDYLTFRVRKHADQVVNGVPASVIRLNLSGLLGWFLPYIEVSYSRADRVLLRYKGLTNVWDSRRDNLTAQIDFPAGERRQERVSLEDARAERLVSSCS